MEIEPFLNRVFVDPLAGVTLQHLLGLATQHFYAFLLVLVRVSGLMTIGPLFGQSIVPANVRIFLVLTISLILTPMLNQQAKVGFDRLDANQNELLSRDEIPEHLLERFDSLVVTAGKLPGASLQKHEFSYPIDVPKTVLDFAWVGVGEFGIGLALGLGVLTILSGLQLTGELIDQQTGIALGGVFNPGLDAETSVSGQLLYLLGIVVMLCMEPIGGHIMMVSALVETFQTLPAGEGFLSVSTFEFLRDLVHMSLVLAVQVAAPLLAMMSLVALTMGFLGHTVPQINVLVVGFPVRAMVNLVVLAITLSGAARHVVNIVPYTIDSLRASLAGV